MKLKNIYFTYILKNSIQSKNLKCEIIIVFNSLRIFMSMRRIFEISYICRYVFETKHCNKCYTYKSSSFVSTKTALFAHKSH